MQNGTMLAGLDPVLEEHRPDWVLVYGDTNSTLAAAVSAVKMHLPVAHLEAGLRSFNRRMPEEHNRVLTDHASDLLLCPSEAPAANLRAEGVRGRIEVVGDVMVDVAQLVGPRAPRPDAQGYVLVTAHRAGNVDDPARLARLVDLLLGRGNRLRQRHPGARAWLRKVDEEGVQLRLGASGQGQAQPLVELVVP